MASHLDLQEQVTRTDSSYCWRYKYSWFRKVSAQVSAFGGRMRGAAVLELGAGVHNPLASSVLALTEGASVCAAVEPGRLHEGFARLASITACLSIAIDVRDGNDNSAALQAIAGQQSDSEYLQGLSPHLRLFNVPLQSLPSDMRFDVVHSNAVLEHVGEFGAALESLFELTASRGLHIHKVDFADHRYYSDATENKSEMFRYMRRNDIEVLDVNRLRYSEMIGEFERVGFVHVGTPELWHVMPPPEVWADLSERYAALPRSDVTTTSAVLVFRKR
jgi:hypothetical protein